MTTCTGRDCFRDITHEWKIDPGEVARRVYREVGHPEPQVRHYSSVAEAIRDFPSWKQEILPLTEFHWQWKYPVLYPNSYSIKYRLFQERFQLSDLGHADLGAHFRISSQVSVPGESFVHFYVTTAIDASLRYLDGAEDYFYDQVVAAAPDFFDKVLDTLGEEYPDGVNEHILLGDFKWLRIERDLLRATRSWAQKPLWDEHFQNVNSICDSNAVFLTLSRLVLVIPFKAIGWKPPGI